MVGSHWNNVFVVAIFQDKDVAVVLIRLIATICQLITSLVNTHTLTIVARELLFSAPGHLQLYCVLFTVPEAPNIPLIVQLCFPIV